MSDPYHGHQRPSDTVPHQDEQEALLTTMLQAASTHAAIANPASPGGGYVQAEAVAVRDALVSVLEVLRDAGLIPAS